MVYKRWQKNDLAIHKNVHKSETSNVLWYVQNPFQRLVSKDIAEYGIRWTISAGEKLTIGTSW